MTPERAEILALEALGWLAGQPEEMQRFLNLSGLDVAGLRDSAGTSEGAAALLDFLLGDEPLMLRFCADFQIDPRQMQIARNAVGTR
jgi:uncharacterized protein DUF3572